MQKSDYFIEATWGTGFVISSLTRCKNSVVVLLCDNSWYALACNGEEGEIWPVREVNETYLSQLSALFIQGELLEREEEIEPLLQFIWENEFGPI